MLIYFHSSSTVILSLTFLTANTFTRFKTQNNRKIYVCRDLIATTDLLLSPHVTTFISFFNIYYRCFFMHMLILSFIQYLLTGHLVCARLLYFRQCLGDTSLFSWSKTPYSCGVFHLEGHRQIISNKHKK